MKQRSPATRHDDPTPNCWLAAATVAASLLDFMPLPLRLPGRTGMLLGAVVALVFVAHRVMLVWSSRTAESGERAGATSATKRVAGGLLAVCVAYALAAVGAGDRWYALAEAGRVVIVSAFFFTVLTSDAKPLLRRVLGQIAALIIVAFAAQWLVGLAVSGARPHLFELGHHHNLGSLPRFHGVAPNPFSAGILMLVCAAMVTWLPHRLSRSAKLLALFLAAVTLSFATVVLPIWLLVEYAPQRTWRWFVVAAATLSALTILYAFALTVRVAETDIVVGERHPNDRGEYKMPAAWLDLGPVDVEVVATRYAVLARRAVTCWQERPVTGVGGRNFASACPVWQMAPAGTWDNHSRSHSQYGGLLAETGLLGLLAVLLLVWALVRSTRLAAPLAVAQACLVAYLVAAFGGDTWFLFPFAAWLGAALELHTGTEANT